MYAEGRETDCSSVGSEARFATTFRKSFATNGLLWMKAGRCAAAQSGRVVVDSQSIMHVWVYWRD
jgi:hypothetical protein